jgi:hypothetical protein
MTSASNYSPGGDSTKNDHGIAFSHAYTILGVEEITLTGGSKKKLIKMRNPWGTESYTGPWADSDSRWDQTSSAEKERIGLVKTIYDGVFFMDLPTFKESFMFTSIAQDLSTYHHNYFLRLNDKTTVEESPGSGYYCGKTCVAHTIYIDSPITQKLYISTHLHDVRSYPLDCNPTQSWAGLRYNFGSYTYQTGWFEGPYNFQV